MLAGDSIVFINNGEHFELVMETTSTNDLRA